ncbi:uncharacterized protein LOC110657571 isoform X2 [Hevea brasiliensis]|uniref:uncharacterized protein LOC110657571 isoform X2 n=1 Tax=Hevea brasiliensis TaxID=3981 RepID=UPI002600E791|nr:uncharacterized protein LOC110657571 isoform X2 [Hevea brasiliensis]
MNLCLSASGNIGANQEMTDEGGLPSFPLGHMNNLPASFPSTPDASIGSALGSCPSNRIMIKVVRGKFIPNGHAISTHIMGTFRERQNATGYIWKNVSPSTRDFYLWIKWRL